MLPLGVLLFFLPAQSFWEARPVPEWTDVELKQMLADSPWAQTVTPAPLVTAILATARPIEEAEAESLRRRGASLVSGAKAAAPDIDYIDYVQQHRDEHFVLAIPYPSLAALGKGEEEKRMEEQCVLRVARRRYRLLGHFPPTPSDPVLRLIFPRVVTPADKTFSFDLYLPGMTHPSRVVEFRVKDLTYKGKLEM
jgi:hypothetical protein